MALVYGAVTTGEHLDVPRLTDTTLTLDLDEYRSGEPGPHPGVLVAMATGARLSELGTEDDGARAFFEVRPNAPKPSGSHRRCSGWRGRTSGTDRSRSGRERGSQGSSRRCSGKSRGSLGGLCPAMTSCPAFLEPARQFRMARRG